jgi:hypothetical protein
MTVVNQNKNDSHNQRIYWVKGSFMLDNELEMLATSKSDVVETI